MYPIPANATRIDYIAGNSGRTAYFRTPIIPTSTMKIEAEISYDSGAGSGWWFETETQYYNTTSTTTTGDAFGFGWNSSEPFRTTYGGGFTRGPRNVFPAGTKMKLVFQSGLATVGGTTWANRSGSTLTQTRWLAILANHRGSSDSTIERADAKYHLHSFRATDGGVVITDYVPVRVGQVGYLFDRVSGTLLGNAGTGDFVLGHDDFSIFSHAVKHLSGTGTFLASRAMGDSSGTVKAVRKHYDMPMQYTIDECNGNSPTAANVYFPSGKYEDLDYTPTWSGHRFVGWYTTSATPSTTAQTSGTQVQKGDSVVFDRSTVYARWQLPTTVTFDATTNGGQMPSGWTSPDYYVGQPYGTLPQPTKSGEVFLGWFTSGGTRVTAASTVTTGTLTARYAAVTYATKWEVNCTSTSYLKTGIYSARSRNSENPTVVDWGDGTYDVIYGNISQLVHTYASTGTRTVQVSDNISSFALSTSGTTFCQTTTSNYYNVRRILAVSPNVTSIPTYAFYYLYDLYSVVFGGNGETISLGSYAFYYAMRSGTAGTIDLSGRRCTSIPAYFCYYCYYLKNFYWPIGVTSIGSSAFRFCFYYSASTGTVEIPEGVTSISGTYAFSNCLYLTAVTLPSTLTNLNNYTFYNCTRLATITSNRSTAPTVSSATFGNGTTYYTGRSSYSAGTNRLYVPAGATGYDASYWLSPLCNSTMCGFTKEEVAA